MSSTEWNIETISHALPTPEMRQECLREILLAPRGEGLREALDRWQKTAVQWTTVEAPKIEAARRHLDAHDGTPPAEYAEETPDSQARYADWRARMRAAQNRGAA